MSSISFYRVVDANLNRLREGVRVCEEFFRFLEEEESIAVSLKQIRHQVQEIENHLDRNLLLAARDSGGDMLAKGMIAKELQRENVETLVLANFRRSQEAARVLEEFLKLSDVVRTAEIAKEIRFSLYTIEKKWGVDDAKEKTQISSN